ncbi:protein RTF1 homolog [Rutidosis leptorrhynchoides]|uniref:protein RTF1 homolog n=1 Tax=Rutidosis leptorrhynchoides TaxID=125765 RepID=UPI003A99E065
MADLDDLLLEAAGRTNTAGRNRHSVPPSKRRRDGSESDGGSDSREDSDDDRGYASRKPSGSQVPLKKRLDPTDRDEDQGSQEDRDYEDGRSEREGDSSDDSDIGEDLYKNEDDRIKLAQMSELEREMILSERAVKKGDKTLTEKLRSKRENDKSTKSRKETPPQTSSRGVRSSARSADRAAAKDDALNELRAKRLKHQDPEAHRKLRDATTRGSSGGRGFSPIKRKAFTSASVSSSQSESESRSDDEGSTGMGDSDDERGTRSNGLKFEDIKEITIRRSKLAKWLMEPFFEELIVGCYVRVGIGTSKSGKPIYRLCMVRNVDATEPNKRYKLENKITHKFLDVIWANENSAARWQMAMVSDSPPLEEEFRQLVKEVEQTGGRMPSKLHVSEKKEAIQKASSYVYSAATVKQMLEEKKSASARPLNVALEKDRLKRQLEIAQLKKDNAEVEKINGKLQQLEASRQAQEKDKKAMRLAEMNRKNRVENFKNASESKRNTGLKAGEEGYDPFSRRWTRSRNYYAAKAKDGEGEGDGAADNNTVEGKESNGEEEKGDDGMVNGQVLKTSDKVKESDDKAALQAAAGAGKLVNTSAPVDEGTNHYYLHDFKIKISLAALDKFGGPEGAHDGYLARKQRIEATVGYKVPENDGRRHALTLSVADYKRRRGLTSDF